MRAFLTRIEDFFAKAFSAVGRVFSKKKGTEERPPKKPGLFDRLDAALARHDGSFLIWSFFLSAAILLLTYVAIGVHPFGESSVLVLDLNGQYVQFFAGLRALLHGDGSILYSFSRSLGGEFLGIYTYYLASPLSFLVALFPEGNILEALLVMFVLKGGLAGLNFGAFLHYSRRPPKTLTVGLSVLYALSSYVVVMQHNTMWIDGLMLLPLLMLGLERLIKYKKPILYTVTLAVTLLANYYIGYMICIFTAMYFFYYFLASASEERNPRGEKHHFLASLLRVGVFTVIALAIAALLLLPAYYSLTFGKTDFSTGDFTFRTKFDIIDFIAKLFPGAYDTVRPEGLPWVYSGVLSLILLPLYFIAGKIPSREKIASGALLFLLFLSMYINTFDVLWHGGQAPNWLNYRYSFLFIFVVLLLSARAASALRSVPPSAILAVCGAILLLTV
ncbi:MAG: YfhO family protein, partial [Clostridia bacterium]|nr:YfhO family protein [Clostridia bacterium]